MKCYVAILGEPVHGDSVNKLTCLLQIIMIIQSIFMKNWIVYNICFKYEYDSIITNKNITIYFKIVSGQSSIYTSNSISCA